MILRETKEKEKDAEMSSTPNAVGTSTALISLTAAQRKKDSQFHWAEDEVLVVDTSIKGEIYIYHFLVFALTFVFVFGSYHFWSVCDDSELKPLQSSVLGSLTSDPMKFVLISLDAMCLTLERVSVPSKVYGAQIHVTRNFTLSAGPSGSSVCYEYEPFGTTDPNASTSSTNHLFTPHTMHPNSLTAAFDSLVGACVHLWPTLIKIRENELKEKEKENKDKDKTEKEKEKPSFADTVARAVAVRTVGALNEPSRTQTAHVHTYALAFLLDTLHSLRPGLSSDPVIPALLSRLQELTQTIAKRPGTEPSTPTFGAATAPAAAALGLGLISLTPIGSAMEVDSKKPALPESEEQRKQRKKLKKEHESFACTILYLLNALPSHFGSFVPPNALPPSFGASTSAVASDATNNSNTPNHHHITDYSTAFSS